MCREAQLGLNLEATLHVLADGQNSDATQKSRIVQSRLLLLRLY